MAPAANATSQKRSNWGIAAITFLNSLATGVLWNGLGFVTDRQFHYTQTETFLLFIATGGVYTIAAMYSGSLVRRLGHHTSPRRIMAWLFGVQIVVAPAVYFGQSSLGLVVVAVVTSVTGALLWPIVEAYVAAGRSPDSARRAIGRWCLVWMGSVALVLVLMAPLTNSDGRLTTKLALAAIAPMSLLSLICLRFVAKRPAAHCEGHEVAPAAYTMHLRSARILLPASYLLVGALSPLMPYLLDRLDLPLSAQTPLTAIWLTARLVVVAVLAHVWFWHGRWGALLCGALCLAGGFALVVAVPSVPTVIAGLALFGAGHGVIYYAALYYALRVGNTEVDAGSTHEALIGLGYVVGPAAGLAGTLLGGGGWTVGIIWLILALVAIPACQPWVTQRRTARVLQRAPDQSRAG
ncbi:MAG: MFS transporter [Phycisphaerales bacterium]|nr:MFS transporter [Phycisphaerales bacterium]